MSQVTKTWWPTCTKPHMHLLAHVAPNPHLLLVFPKSGPTKKDLWAEFLETKLLLSNNPGHLVQSLYKTLKPWFFFTFSFWPWRIGPCPTSFLSQLKSLDPLGIHAILNLLLEHRTSLSNSAYPRDLELFLLFVMERVTLADWDGNTELYLSSPSLSWRLEVVFVVVRVALAGDWKGSRPASQQAESTALKVLCSQGACSYSLCFPNTFVSRKALWGVHWHDNAQRPSNPCSFN